MSHILWEIALNVGAGTVFMSGGGTVFVFATARCRKIWPR